MNPRNHLDVGEPAPSRDFAERTARVLLADRGARRIAAKRRRRLAVAVLASGLLAGAAWGFAALVAGPSRPVGSAAPPAASGPSRLVDAAVVQKAEAPPRAEATAPSASAPTTPEPAPPIVRRKERKAAPVPSTVARDAGQPLVRPRCECQQGQVICDCLE